MHNFQSFLVDLVTVSIVLGIMIFVHEWGHFAAAKLCGVRVDVFSLGFGPRLFGVKRGDTDYRLSALPFGGYVRMAGDNPLEERTGAGYEFLSRPRWQRVIIAIAGPAMNFVLALVILWGLFWRLGIPSPVYEHQPAIITATVPEHLASPDTLFGYPPLPAVIADVEPGTPADRTGLKPGDTIVAMNGKPIITWPQLVEGVHQSGGHPVQFRVLRDGQNIEFDITPMQGMDVDGQPVWQVGVASDAKEDYVRQPFFSAGKEAAASTVAGIHQIGQVLVGLFSGKVSIRQLAGPVGIARISGEAAKRGPAILLGFMAVISLNLGLLNLLPIPILDGGHILMLAIEGILRRDLSITVKERFVQVGLVFLLGIFAFVMYSDILKAVQSHR
jgi:regulator of sigma E protease